MTCRGLPCFRHATDDASVLILQHPAGIAAMERQLVPHLATADGGMDFVLIALPPGEGEIGMFQIGQVIEVRSNQCRRRIGEPFAPKPWKAS